MEQHLILWSTVFQWKLQGAEAANTMGEKVLSLPELSFNPVFKGRGFAGFRAREERENNSYPQHYCCYLLDAYHVLSAVLSNSVQSYNDSEMNINLLLLHMYEEINSEKISSWPAITIYRKVAKS